MARYFEFLPGGAFLILSLAWAGALTGQEERRPTLFDLSLEELIDVEVTSVSMKEERWFTAPAAVHVVTGEDIRRSGVTSLAEALRLVPGMQVARYNSNEWAISARGFNDVWANKLLVLVDGRSVYNPLFAGVQWDIQDLVLEDVARIEVIRGPGATLWGANAVNGVINVVTKAAHETQGALVSVGTGTEDRVLGTVRHGVLLRPGLAVRAFAKYTRRDRLSDPLGAAATGEWDVARGGGRLEWVPNERDHLTLDGAAFDGDAPELQTIVLPGAPYQTVVDTVATMGGGWVLARWQHQFHNRSDIELLAYFDQSERHRVNLREDRSTWNVEVRHRLKTGRSELVWGAGYRHDTDRFTPTYALTYNPTARETELWSLFVQEEVTLVPDRLTITGGTKLEDNPYSGFEIQPSVRMLWTPHARHTAWASVSRAVRTPSRSDRDLQFTAAIFPDSSGLLTHVEVLGSPDFRSEELVAFELGYRIRPARNLWLDLSAFHNRYDHLRTAVIGQPFMRTTSTPAHLVVPRYVINGAEGTTQGIELLVHVQPTARWRLTGSYSTIDVDLRDKSAAAPSNAQAAGGDIPTHQGYVRSELDLPNGVELDLAVFAVDDLPNKQVPAYARFDVRLGWRIYSGLNMSLGVQNAFQARHWEFGTTEGTLLATVERSVVGKITWRF